MAHDPYLRSIENLLRSISQLERKLSASQVESERQKIRKALRNRQKRLELLIPFQFRLQLHNLCKEVGVKTDLV